MKKIITFSFLFTLFLMVNGQSYEVDRELQLKPYKRVVFSELPNIPITIHSEFQKAPKPISNVDEIKAKLDAQRKRNSQYLHKSGSYQAPNDSLKLLEIKGFRGNPNANPGIPNDNTLAVNNEGVVISAVNSHIHILDKDGNLLWFRILNIIGQLDVGVLNRTYDPKVIFDPINERFILVFLQGSTSEDTRIIVGFSETSDPLEAWNFYQITGKPTGGTTWSDYPIIAHSKEDLYITVNLLKDDESWQEGFIESFIWQVNKNDGYEGKELTQNLFREITFNHKSVWSICPIQESFEPEQNNMYFLSVRPDTESNDTVFLHEITNSVKSGKAEHKLSVLVSDKKYGVPPSAFQPMDDFRLQTNDTRVLSGVFHNGNIHYVQTTHAFDFNSSGVYHGIIYDVATAPKVEASIIAQSDMDFGYPSIAFGGKTKKDDHAMVITFSHSSEKVFPGTSFIIHNKIGNFESVYSPVFVAKKGDGLINSFLPDSIERWGDYTDIQMQINEPGTLWIGGSYGNNMDRNAVWVSKIKVETYLELLDSLKPIIKPEVNEILACPNPSYDFFRIKFNQEEEQDLDISIVDLKGVRVLNLKQPIPSGKFEIVIDSKQLASGMYFVEVRDQDRKILLSQKLLVANQR